MQLDGLVEPKWYASVLSERIGFLKDYIIGRMYFYPTTHMIFPGGSVMPGSCSLTSGPLIVSARPKIDT